MTDWLARLKDDLTDEGAEWLTSDEGVPLILQRGGHSAASTWEVDFTREQLTDYIGVLAPDGASLWPEADRDEAGYRLFLVHLDELMDRETGGHALRIADQALVRSS